MQCTQDTIHSEDVIVVGNGREISMVKFAVEEQSRVPLAACIVVHGKEVMAGSNCRTVLNAELKEIKCTQDSIQAGDVMVLGNGREVSMVRFSVEERSRVPLNACIVVYGNEIINCRNHLECHPGSVIKRLVRSLLTVYCTSFRESCESGRRHALARYIDTRVLLHAQ